MEQEIRDEFKCIKETMQDNHDEIMTILKGEGRDTGLVGDVNMLKKAYRCTIGAVVFLVTTIVVQIICYVRGRL